MLIRCLILILLLAVSAHAGDYALDFTTGNDHMEVPYDASLNLPDGVTIETWVNFDNVAGGIMVIIGKPYDETHTSPYFDWSFAIQNDDILFRIGTSQWQISNILSVDTWYHIVLTADGTKKRLYIDGSPQDSTTSTGLPSNTNSQGVLFGQNASSAEEFDGTIDEVRIYNVALSAAQISTHYNSGAGTCDYQTDNLKGCWHFNEGSGTTAADDSGEDNTGNLLPEGDEPAWVTGIGLDCNGEPPEAERTFRRRESRRR